jgi:hypothetical protein
MLMLWMMMFIPILSSPIVPKIPLSRLVARYDVCDMSTGVKKVF